MPILNAAEIAKFIDHTLLKPDATQTEYRKLCQEAASYGFYSVCVPPSMVSFARGELRHSNVKVCTVVGFPLGYSLTSTKVFETKCAVDQGAEEIDMVINISALKSGDLSLVKDDIQFVVHAAFGVPVKVIFETCYLSDAEIRSACDLAAAAGAKFFKTSTGFGSGGATEAHVALLVECAQKKIGVKASGGIRNTQAALKMLGLGANRLGTSNGVAIVSGVAESSLSASAIKY